MRPNSASLTDAYLALRASSGAAKRERYAARDACWPRPIASFDREATS
jgi:hypothetical protein